MRKSPIRFAFALATLLAVSTTALAITGDFVNLVCPVCKTKDKYWIYFSYGSYIYRYPSKYQLIFWPHTDPVWLYHCRKCRLTVFGDDFQNPPETKLEETRAALASVKVTYDTGLYHTIPMFERLEIAEKVYQLWGLDDERWCRFYRVKGYHLQREKQFEAADAARQRALELAQKMLADPAEEGRRKELLVITAAMRHYLRNDQAALADLRAAKVLRFSLLKLSQEENKNADTYFSTLIDDYIDALEKGRSTDEKNANP